MEVLRSRNSNYFFLSDGVQMGLSEIQGLTEEGDAEEAPSS